MNIQLHIRKYAIRIWKKECTISDLTHVGARTMYSYYMRRSAHFLINPKDQIKTVITQSHNSKVKNVGKNIVFQTKIFGYSDMTLSPYGLDPIYLDQHIQFTFLRQPINALVVAMIVTVVTMATIDSVPSLCQIVLCALCPITILTIIWARYYFPILQMRNQSSERILVRGLSTRKWQSWDLIPVRLQGYCSIVLTSSLPFMDQAQLNKAKAKNKSVTS